MEILSGSTLADAFKFCDQSPGARIGIACTYRQTADVLIDTLWGEITNGRMPGWEMGRAVGICGESKLMRRFNSVRSSIEIFAPSYVEHIRGRSYHKVLHEKDLPGCIAQELCWTERLSFACEDEAENEGSELDEFLNSFKIV